MCYGSIAARGNEALCTGRLYTQPKSHQVVAILSAEQHCNNVVIIFEQHH